MSDKKLTATWKDISLLLKENVSSTIFSAWLKKLKPVSLTEDTLTLQAPSEQAKNQITDKYLQFLTITAFQVTQKMLKVIITCEEPLETLPLEDPPPPADSIQDELAQLQKNSRRKSKKTQKIVSNLFQPTLTEAIEAPPAVEEKPEEEIIPPSDNSLLNPRYVFETFVTGSSNQLAHAAALAVAENPATAYNPFFMYGDVGVGKTHLMHAIAHRILKNNPTKRVLYISSEQFTNELINSIRDGKPDRFRKKYRSIDVLLVDDVQFLAKKEHTQEEFFNTFNALIMANKQIILSSDRPPKEIETLNKRLRTRFEAGLIADIQVPDFETRIAILKKKSLIENVNVPMEVITFIATNINDNIRELEGALTRVIAYASITHMPITYELATQTLKGIMAPVKTSAPKDVNIASIQEVICKYFKVSLADINGKKRTRTIVYPRQIAMYLSRELTSYSLPKIGNSFGKRDHTTVMHACKKIKKLIKDEPDTARLIEELKNKITHG